MLTRTAAHYPNSGHTSKTLVIVAEDWFHTFSGKVTDKAFIEAVTVTRRKSKFFPTEAEIFEVAGLNTAHSCKGCGYFNGGSCPNLKKEGFQADKCNSYLSKIQHTGSI